MKRAADREKRGRPPRDRIDVLALQVAMLEARVSPHHLAKLLCVSVSTVRCWLRGRGAPSQPQVARIASRLRVTQGSLRP